MKWETNESKRVRRKEIEWARISKWHPWFAWRPVLVRSLGPEHKVWLVIVERRRLGDWWSFSYWEYREST